MTLAEKFQSIIILAAVFAGIALGRVPEIAQIAAHLILPLLMMMLTGVFLYIPLHRFGDVFQYRGVAAASLVINFVWAPLLAWLLGWVFLGGHPALWVGFLMLMVTPCTDWNLVFTGIAKGNLALSTALLRAFFVSRWLKTSHENFVSLGFTISARNSPIALAIALVAFPDEPLVPLALVIGPLIELPVLAVISQILLWMGRRRI